MCALIRLKLHILFILELGVSVNDKLKFEQGESPALSLAGTQRSPSLCGVATFPALMLGAGPTR